MSHEYSSLSSEKNASALVAKNAVSYDTLAAESGADESFAIAKRDSAIADDFSKASNYLGKFSTFARRSVLALDVADKVSDVIKAPTGQHGKTAFEKGMQFGGEFFGGSAATVGIAFFVPESFGTDLFVATPTILGGASMGGYTGIYTAKKIETVGQSAISFLENKWRS